MVYSQKYCSRFSYQFLESTYFFLILSFYVSQVHNSHKVSIEADRKVKQIFQSSMGTQVGFYTKTLNTQRAWEC